MSSRFEMNLDMILPQAPRVRLRLSRRRIPLWRQLRKTAMSD